MVRQVPRSRTGARPSSPRWHRTTTTESDGRWPDCLLELSARDGSLLSACRGKRPSPRDLSDLTTIALPLIERVHRDIERHPGGLAVDRHFNHLYQQPLVNARGGRKAIKKYRRRAKTASQHASDMSSGCCRFGAAQQCCLPGNPLASSATRFKLCDCIFPNALWPARS